MTQIIQWYKYDQIDINVIFFNKAKDLLYNIYVKILERAWHLTLCGFLISTDTHLFWIFFVLGLFSIPPQSQIFLKLKDQDYRLLETTITYLCLDLVPISHFEKVI